MQKNRRISPHSPYPTPPRPHPQRRKRSHRRPRALVRSTPAPHPAAQQIIKGEYFLDDKNRRNIPCILTLRRRRGRRLRRPRQNLRSGRRRGRRLRRPCRNPRSGRRRGRRSRHTRHNLRSAQCRVRYGTKKNNDNKNVFVVVIVLRSFLTQNNDNGSLERILYGFSTVEFNILFEYEVPADVGENPNEFLLAKSLPEWGLMTILVKIPM